MSEPPGSAASALTPATAPAALGHSSSQRSSVDNLSEGRSRSASPGKKNPFAKMADKIGGLFQKKKDRRPSATSDLSADSSQTGSRRMSTSSSVDEQRQRPPPSPVPPASILVTSGKAPWGSIPILDPTSPTTFSPVAVALIVDDHSHPHMTEEPVSEQLAGPAYIDKTPIEPPVRLVEEPDQRPSLYDYDDYADSGASSSEESSDEEHVRPRGRKPRSAAARMSGWFRRLSLSPLPRTLSEPTREDPAVVQHSDTFARTATLGVPSASGVANRSRSVGATGGGSGRRDSNEMGRPVSITFDVDEGRTQEGRRQARARSSDDKSRRNSIFSLFSGKGDNTDSESVGGSIFSFGKRRKTDGSVGTQSAAPIFVEPPLPPLMLSGRYSDAKTVLDEATAEEIRKHLPRRLREAVKWPLLYSMDMHGTAFSSFYLLTQGKGPTIWAFEDTKGVIFGVFVSEDIEMVPAGGGFYGTGESFLWEKLPRTTSTLVRPPTPQDDLEVTPASRHFETLPVPKSPSFGPSTPVSATTPRRTSIKTPPSIGGTSPRVRFESPTEAEMPSLDLQSPLDDRNDILLHRFQTEPGKFPSILARAETMGSTAASSTVPRPFSLVDANAPTVRVHPATGYGAAETYFVSTRRDCMVFGGHSNVGLWIDKDFESGYSDGRCDTFELDGVPLGSEAEDVAGFLQGDGELVVPLKDADGPNGDDTKRYTRRFDIRALEVWGIDVNYVRRASDAAEVNLTSAQAALQGKGFGRWVEGDDKFGEVY